MQIMTAAIRMPYAHVVLNCVIFLYDICQVFPKYYFNKPWFELPHNVTWTDE